MQVKLLDGTTQKIDLKKYLMKDTSRSNFQLGVGNILKSHYPMDVILEEVYIRGEKLVLDFFIPSRRLAVECNGIQHSKFVKFFHGTIKGFHNQQDRDVRKREWCRLNNIRLIEVSATMSLSEIVCLLGS
jgi:hypothetical protein